MCVSNRSVSSNKTGQGRSLEIYFVISLAIIITVSTITVITLRNCDVSLSEKCGPEYPNYSVNITDADETPDGGYKSDGVTYPRGTFWKSNGQIFGCPCAVKPCIRKCCGLTQAFVINNDTMRVTCIAANTSFNILQREIFSNVDLTDGSHMQPVDVDFDRFYVFYGKPCEKMFVKSPKDYPEDEHYITVDGRIYSPNSKMPYIDQSNYCFEANVGTDGTIDTYECVTDISEMVQEEKEGWTFDVLLVGMCISIPCLILTFVVYAILPHKNLHGKCLMCHVACLTLGYVTLATLQFPGTVVTVGHPSCIVAGFIVQFSFLGSFFWLNSMCFDIWWVFSGLTKTEEQFTKFLMYSLYSWGSPLLIVAITAFMEYVPWALPCTVRPGFGIDRCWFYNFDARVLYLYLPIGVLITVNLVMFSTTFRRLHLQNKIASKFMTNNDSKRHNVSEKHRFKLYLNLFIVMGVTWVMEVLSFAVGGSRVYWLVTDLANALQGVFIFIIFVCKRRTLHQLNKKICPGTIIIGPTSAMRDSNRTSSTRYSSQSMMKLRRTSTDPV